MRSVTTKQAIIGVLALQAFIACVLMAGDLFRVLPQIAWPSSQPAFDTPVLPGDQRRRYRPNDMPLSPSRDGNPERPFRSTGDMPTRLNFVVEDDTLVMTGAIEAGDAERAVEPLADDSIARVRLNSPGGSVQDALAIGRAVRGAALDTVMGAGDICLSACPYILAGGTDRVVHEDAQVGVHQHYFGTNSALPAFMAVEGWAISMRWAWIYA